ncbi:Translin [Tilletiaria anomala UBC 951]|uniref:Translin n=1 Tax=Tilletiaria anomala (strain ATCC 24038 / CBS 436.72 / UBC 951) TaxID=1037660 RepID=A0A066VXW2_TILAU|nr:Translin [Tilletiaria anomala UBC 951]KDN43335.1 Translin [Tilletiaria anomala UBC 951]
MTSPSTLLDAFAGFRAELDSHHDRNERLVRFSRDVTAESKKLIFLLQRYNPCADAVRQGGDAETAQSSSGTGRLVHPANRKVLEQAENKADEITRLIIKTAQQERLGPEHAQQSGSSSNDVQTTNDWLPPAVLHVDRYERAFGQGLEEYIEAISFLHYLEHGAILPYSVLQERFRDLSSSGAGTTLLIPPHRYLLGLCDLSGELMRHATNAVGLGTSSTSEPGYVPTAPDAVVASVLSTIRALYAHLETFTPYISRGELNKKQAVTDQSARKIEQLLYSIKVREREYAGGDAGARNEMLRRALLSAAVPSSAAAPSAADDAGRVGGGNKRPRQGGHSGRRDGGGEDVHTNFDSD